MDLGVSNLLPDPNQQQSAGASSGLTFWKGFEGANFAEYQLHRSLTPGFTPKTAPDALGPATLVYSTPNIGATQWTDTAPLSSGQPGVYYYKLVVVHGAGGALRSYSHEAAMDYDDLLSTALGCNAAQLTCVG